jgi:hypothetical protein
MLLLRIYVAGNNKKYLGFHEFVGFFCPILTNSVVFRQIFFEFSSIEVHGHPLTALTPADGHMM